MIILSYFAPPITQKESLIGSNKIKNELITQSIASQIDIDWFNYLKLINLFLFFFSIYTKKYNFLCFYLSIYYLSLSLFQGLSIGSKYGLSIMLNIFIPFFILSNLWLREFLYKKRSISFNLNNLSLFQCLLIVISLITYYLPFNFSKSHFDIDFFLNNTALTFCFTSPMHLVFLLFIYQKNRIRSLKNIIRLESFIGIIISLNTLIYIISPEARLLGIFHFPLFFISFYSFLTIMRYY